MFWRGSITHLAARPTTSRSTTLHGYAGEQGTGTLSSRIFTGHWTSCRRSFGQPDSSGHPDFSITLCRPSWLRAVLLERSAGLFRDLVGTGQPAFLPQCPGGPGRYGTQSFPCVEVWTARHDSLDLYHERI